MKGLFLSRVFQKNIMSAIKTFMNEELTVAIEELRQRSGDRIWFIPIQLNECEIWLARVYGIGSYTEIYHTHFFESF